MFWLKNNSLCKVLTTWVKSDSSAIDWDSVVAGSYAVFTKVLKKMMLRMRKSIITDRNTHVAWNQEDGAALILEVHTCRMRGIAYKLQSRTFLWDSGSTFWQQGWSDPGTGCLKRLWNLHFWRLSECSRNRLTATHFKRACFESKVGLEQFGSYFRSTLSYESM